MRICSRAPGAALRYSPVTPVSDTMRTPSIGCCTTLPGS